MDPSNQDKQYQIEEPRFLDFPHLSANATTEDGRPRLNKFSSTITKDHDFPGAQVCLGDWAVEVIAHLRPGNVVRSRRAGPGVDEEQPSRRRGFSMVGRQPVQVRLNPGFPVSSG